MLGQTYLQRVDEFDTDSLSDLERDAQMPSLRLELRNNFRAPSSAMKKPIQ